jgi:hypothetical protein
VITLIGAVAGERRLKLSFPEIMIQFQILMIDKVWTHILVVIIYLTTLLEDLPGGDSTFQSWLNL